MSNWWDEVYQEQWTVSLLPPSNSTSWELAVEAVDADLVARDPVGLIAAARSVAEVPAPWLPYLAAERSVDEFTSAWPIERQRAVTAASFGMHQVKGTRPALVRALAPLGFDVSVIEWFEAEGRDPNTFRLRVDIGEVEPWEQGDHDILVRVANQAKNAHTKLETVSAARRLVPARLYIGGALRMRWKIRIEDRPPVLAPIKGLIFIGGSVRIRLRLQVGARA